MDAYRARLQALLGERDPIQVLRETPARLEGLVQGADLDLPWREGGWTGRQILCHLADAELALGFRMRQVVAAEGDGFEIQPYDQDAWARDYERLEPSLALEAFRAVRSWNLAWLARRDLHDWLRAYRHPERPGEEETLDELVRFIAGHDLNHLAQLERVGSGAAW